MQFQSYHPVIHLVYFAAVISFGLLFNHPCFLLCTYVCAFICSIRIVGRKSVIYNFLLLLFAFAFTVFYSSYTHFGVTVLTVNIIGNRITLEALIRGAVIGIKAATLLMWFNVLHSVMTTDEIVYLFERISPKLSLYLAILLRMAPCINEERKRIRCARRSAGIRQNPVIGFLSGVSILISWSAERFSDSADSMRSRGYTLKGRTAFSIYRFDNRDRAIVVFMFSLITVLIMAMILGDTAAIYSSLIKVTAVTGRKLLFCLVFVGLSIFPCIPMISKSDS